ncbi:hypothetical protein [Neorhizobium sp. JUb45]|uniref:hypothetical protein n=1 Tax=unclassified Neorhizobium TaxID=2629175 RepID=UPI00105047B5|nr:hypothetical protein [Neorhizobium sp. JUb45]TCR02783.1 hypothetical protein EDF70_103208 [Neorhizobium sp. JUb45]
MTAQGDDYKLILKVLGYALIEIRATDNVRKAQTLADVFHNVPAGIAYGRTPENIRQKLEQTATRLKCKGYIDGMFEDALQNMRQWEARKTTLN